MTVNSPAATSESDTCSPSHVAAYSGGPLRKRKRSESFSQHSQHSPHSQRPPASRELGLMRDNNAAGTQDMPRFVGSSSGIHFIQSVYLRLARKSAGPKRSEDLVPGEDDQFDCNASPHGRSDQPLWEGGELGGAQDVGFEDLVEWSKPYFETWHSSMPFLDAPAILEAFEEIERGGGSITVLSETRRLAVRAVLSISLADCRQGRAPSPHHGRPPRELVFGTIDEALSGAEIALRRPATISSLQAVMCVQLFLVSMLRLNTASRLGGLIVRMAFHLGLHRCPARFPAFSHHEISIRQRVFWSIYVTERFLCQSLGLPLDMRDDDLDVCYPGEERHGRPPPEEHGEGRKLLMLTMLAKHARIRGLILELRNKAVLARDDTAERTDAVHAELAKWTNEIEDQVEDEGVSLMPAQKLVLDILKNESIISLNRPVMASDPHSPSYAAALQHCIGAARAILSTLHRYQTRHESANTSPMLMWPSFTWAVWISTFILIFCAFEQQILLDSALRSANQAKHVLAHMAMRRTAWPEYCLSAVKDMVSSLQDIQCRSSSSTSERSDRQSGYTSQMFCPRQEHSGFIPPRPRPLHRPADSVSSFQYSLDVDAIQPHSQLLDPRFGNTAPRNPQSSPSIGLDYQFATPTHPNPDGTQSIPIPDGAQQRPNDGTQIISGGSTALSDAMAMDPNQEALFGITDGSWYTQLLEDPFNAIGYPFLAAAQAEGVWWEGK